MPAVSLSIFGGVGSQFFDNNGNVLCGGKISTYRGWHHNAIGYVHVKRR